MLPGAPDPPAFLKGEALKEWRRIVPALDEIGILNAADRGILVAYVQAWQRWTELDARITAEGLTVEGRDGLP